MTAVLDPYRGDLDKLCRKYSVRRLELFGSAATGAFDPSRSDFDFLVEFDDLSPTAYADAYFSLKHELEVLFARSIDLITESNLANPFFRKRVLAERQPVYAR
jgi:predicted nucleotidyltransferase